MAKKNWIYVKRGLSENPKHRAQMGECIWLYLHIIDRADWETGTAYDWKDEQEAADMGMPVRTLREQRRKLDEQGYINCKQRQYGQDIVITKWINPRDYSGKVLNEGGSETSPKEDEQGDTQGYIQGDTQGSTQDVTPTSNSKSKSLGTAYRRGEQESPDKLAEWLKMAHVDGAKQSERIDAILSYLGVTFRRNTETKEWKEFAKYILSAEKEFGWKIEEFIGWLFAKPDYNPDYWSVKRMMEFYPSAFTQVKATAPIKEYQPLDESEFVPSPARKP